VQVSVDRPIHPALLATVIAWGAKFSEHPLLVQDREGANGQSRLARTLVNRAREVAEAEKVHRISTVDHVVIALLIEPLQNRMLPVFLCCATYQDAETLWGGSSAYRES
jgi:hypothetical protein